MNIDIPENEVVLAFLKRDNPRKEILVAPGKSPRDPYWELGCHPELVEWLWDDLGRQLSMESRQIVCGRPSLVHPFACVVFAVAYGTQYFLRFSHKIAERAKSSGFKTKNTWNNGTTTDLEIALGADWVFGRCSPQEIEWLRESYVPFAT